MRCSQNLINNLHLKKKKWNRDVIVGHVLATNTKSREKQRESKKEQAIPYILIGHHIRPNIIGVVTNGTPHWPMFDCFCISYLTD